MEKNIYSRAKVSVKLLDAVIVIGFVALIVTTVYLSLKGGFDVRFETDGGSQVASQRLRYGERIVEPDEPTKEGYVFVGWFTDAQGSEGEPVDFENSSVESSVTLYAAWQRATTSELE